MHNAAHVYGRMAKQSARPRELEASLLLQAASRLQAVRDGHMDARPELNEALRFNRKLWSIFLASATNADNPLPAAVRQNVANLGLFVMKHTIATLSDPRPEQLGALISINREMAAGLMGRAA